MSEVCSEGDLRKELLSSDCSCPQPAVNLFPISSVLCAAWSVLTGVAMMVVLAIGGTSERYNHQSDDLYWHSRVALFLTMQAALMELCILISTSAAVGIADQYVRPVEDDAAGPNVKPQPRLGGQQFGDSVLALLEFALKFITAKHLTMRSGIVMHLNTLTADPRPVYFVRFAQWAVAVPILVLLTNRAFLASHGQLVTLRRSAAGLVLSSLYCQCAWLMEVTPLGTARWVLMGLVLGGFVLSSADQVCIAYSVPIVSARKLKLGMLYFQIFSFAMYTGVYVWSYFGFMNASSEQCIYCYMDVTVKVFQSCLLALIRNYENLRIIRHWWLESVAAKRDFERLVKQARVPIFAVDLDGVVTGWNGSLAQLTGLMPYEIIGRAAADLVCKESLEGLRRALADVTAGKASTGLVEIWLQHASTYRSLSKDSKDEAGGSEDRPRSSKTDKDAKPINLVLNFVPRLTREGTIEGIVAIGQDLTELSELKAVEQKKVQLMAVVSHELRSPLHGMIGLTNMLEQQIQGAGFKRQLKMVRCCAQRLLDLVTNIMDLTEAEQRQRKGTPEMKRLSLVNMLEVAQEVTVMTSMAMDKSGKPLVGPELKLVNAMGELREFPFVLGDPYKCTQLLYNLVTNACKFTSKGSVTLRARHVKEMRLLEVDVEDTGVGIADEAQQRIFQPFEQERSSHVDSRNYQGMGLGLSVCFSIARAHGGSIRVRSKVGMGSTFTVALPCEETFVNRNTEDEGLIASVMSQNEEWTSKQYAAKKAVRGDIQGQQQSSGMDVAPLVVASDSSSPPTVNRADAARRTPIILSVDDDEVNQEVIQSALGEQYDVVRAMNGKEALNHLERCTSSTEEADNMPLPDLILLDIQMPGLTGFEVLKELRSKYTSTRAELPVIMVSAKTPTEPAALQSYSDGCSDFLAKPFHTSILKAKIAVLTEIKEGTGRGHMKEETTQREQAEAAARGEAKTMKERAATMKQELSKVQKELEQARAAEATAEEKAAECSAAMEDKVSEIQKELEQARAAEAAAEEMAAECSASMEEKVSEIQKELEEARVAVAAALEKGQEAPVVYESASTEVGSSNFRESVGLRSSLLQPHPKALSMHRVCTPTLRSPKMRLPLTASGGMNSGVAAVPWLYQQIQEHEDKIMNLNEQLAAHRSASEFAARQMELVMQAAEHSRSLLQAWESDSPPGSSRPLPST